MKKYYFKFLRTGLLSGYDKSKWTIGKWRTDKKEIKECVGLNASAFIQDALRYVNGEILAVVEVGGKIIKSSDKITCEKMKIIKTYKWTRTDSVKLAIFCAELSLPIFEKKYPNDNRPKEAIKATKNGLLKKLKYSVAHAAFAAAESAESAYSAYSADSVHAALAAAYSADSASYSEAYAAFAAAESAVHAAHAFHFSVDTKKKIHNFIIKMKRIKRCVK